MPSTKRIVITGVSRGLGRALTEGLVSLGHVVLGCGTNQEAIAGLTAAHASPSRFQVCDVTQDADVQAWAKVVLAAGPPDLLINNAAVINPNAPLWKVSADEFQSVVDVNLCGVVNVIRHFAPAMIAKQSGVIVNLSSGWGRSASPEVAPYCCTKWGIEGLTQAFSQELPRGMAAVALNPGVIDTDMLRSCFGGNASSYPSPQRWAEKAVPFLLGLAAKDNGKALTVPEMD